MATFESLNGRTIEVEVFGVRCRCLDLDALIQTKRAAGRPRDLETISELEIIRAKARGELENHVSSFVTRGNSITLFAWVERM